jgi:uncharacterized protein (DUF885 family)
LTPPAPSTLPSGARPEDPAVRLRRFFDEEWEWTLADQPESATAVGDTRFDDRLSDRSLEAFDRRRAHAKEALARLRAIPREPLEVEDRLSHDFYSRELELAVEGARFPEELAPITQQNGITRISRS